MILSWTSTAGLIFGFLEIPTQYQSSCSPEFILYTLRCTALWNLVNTGGISMKEGIRRFSVLFCWWIEHLRKYISKMIELFFPNLLYKKKLLCSSQLLSSKNTNDTLIYDSIRLTFQNSRFCNIKKKNETTNKKGKLWTMLPKREVREKSPRAKLIFSLNSWN